MWHILCLIIIRGLIKKEKKISKISENHGKIKYKSEGGGGQFKKRTHIQSFCSGQLLSFNYSNALNIQISKIYKKTIISTSGYHFKTSLFITRTSMFEL